MHRYLAETITAFHHGIKQSTRPEDRKIASDFLASLAPLLALAVLGKDILSDIKNVDRLFGHTWITDVEPFREAFEKCNAFKAKYRSVAFSQMTINERLFANGTLTAFDSAKAANNFEQMEKFLREVYVDEESIQMIVSSCRPG